jgi:hypothetical protein
MYLSMSMIVFHPLTHLMLFSKLSVDHIAQFQIFNFFGHQGALYKYFCDSFNLLTHPMVFSRLSVGHIAQFQVFNFWPPGGTVQVLL